MDTSNQTEKKTHLPFSHLSSLGFQAFPESPQKIDLQEFLHVNNQLCLKGPGGSTLLLLFLDIVMRDDMR